VRVLCVGAGPIGESIAAFVAGTKKLALVGVVDPARVGESIGGVSVVGDLAECADVEADVAVLATGSELARISGQIEWLVSAGLDVVSTSEELTYPWLRNPTAAEALDRLAKVNGKTVVASGVNPGFVMDVVPVVLSSGSLEPSRLFVRRDVNLARRRERLREKLGVGLTLDEWNAAGGTELFGHVGLLESAYLCALGLGWTPQESSFDREPICSGAHVVGVREVADVRANWREATLELAFRLGGADEDRIEIEGDPPFSVVWQGGIHGDTATTARILQAVRVVEGMQPGLRLPIEIPAWSEPTQ